ncbi:MAG: ABC transporter ATP-binding protein [Spirochaetes bacterium]|nr:ABC transporter ATP-binding protein [Spirochaetota bacterium]
MSRQIAALEHLKVYFYDQGDRRFIRAVEDVGLTVEQKQVVGLVGESGCGKTITALSMMGLIDGEPGVVGGRFFFRPKEEDRRALIFAIMRGNRKKYDCRKGELFDLFCGLDDCVRFDADPFTVIKDPEKWLRKNGRIMEQMRGRNISMVFQNTREALNPFVTVGSQLVRAVQCLENDKNRAALAARAEELLLSVRIFNPGYVMNMYPDALSIGMSQRVLIAIALASRPGLLIADEPTTGLDTTNKHRIIDLLGENMERGNMSLVIISHNIGIVRTIADRIYVMYAGLIVEHGNKKEIVTGRKNARHPYTEALVSSVPTDADIKRGKKLKVIEGVVPDNKMETEGCPFLPRCRYAKGGIRRKCRTRRPELFEVTSGHRIRCWLFAG